jgi:hexosaminidase
LVQSSMKFFIVGVVLAVSHAVQAVWPMPKSYKTGTSTLTLAPEFNIEFNSFGAPNDLRDAVRRAQDQIRTDKHQRLVVDRGAADAKTFGRAKRLTKLGLFLNAAPGYKSRSIAEEAVLELGSRDEAYTLEIPADGGAAKLSASSALGLFRGLATFTQLWYTLDNTIYTVEAPISIQDSPAFPYRGFMLDTARNYFPVDDIKRTLDSMSSVKINTLHWHIVDSQSFPLRLNDFKELADTGAYSPSQIYSEDNLKDVISYANARGIDVMLEIDTPGHTSVISKSHPEFIACPEAAPWYNYANEPPAGQLRLTQQPVIDFTAKLFTSLLTKVTSPYFSTGGDEINSRCYTEDPVVSKDLAAKGQSLDQALDNFTNQTHAAILKLNKTPVVWQEMVLDHPITSLSKKAIIMVWISSSDVRAVADKGFRIIHSPSDYFYLDCGVGGWVGNNPDGNSWCSPFKTWQHAYSFNPLANLTDTQAKLVLGGQQLLWTEQSDPNNLDIMAWPRAAASAEVFWTGTQAGPLDVKAALPRLHDLRYRLVQRGVKAVALQPHWCALRPHACDL